MNKFNIGILAIAVALGGCTSGTDQPADTAAAAPAAEPASATPSTDPAPAALDTRVTSDNGLLTVDPAVIDACQHPEGVVASDISWNATRAGTEGVEIYLQDPEGEKKLWSAAGAVGGDKTGPWMRDGSQVILVNGNDQQELARITITLRPCAN